MLAFFLNRDSRKWRWLEMSLHQSIAWGILLVFKCDTVEENCYNLIYSSMLFVCVLLLQCAQLNQDSGWLWVRSIGFIQRAQLDPSGTYTVQIRKTMFKELTYSFVPSKAEALINILVEFDCPYIECTIWSMRIKLGVGVTFYSQDPSTWVMGLELWFPILPFLHKFC